MDLLVLRSCKCSWPPTLQDLHSQLVIYILPRDCLKSKPPIPLCACSMAEMSSVRRTLPSSNMLFQICTCTKKLKSIVFMSFYGRISYF